MALHGVTLRGTQSGLDCIVALHVNVKMDLTDLRIDTRSVPGAASGWAKAEARRRGKGGESVNASEYDFSGVPDEDLEGVCVHYEYAWRESVEDCCWYC